MKTFSFLLLLGMLCALILGGCAKTSPEPTHKAINPGDKVGDILITTVDKAVFVNLSHQDCRKQGEGEK